LVVVEDGERREIDSASHCQDLVLGSAIAFFIRNWTCKADADIVIGVSSAKSDRQVATLEWIAAPRHARPTMTFIMHLSTSLLYRYPPLAGPCVHFIFANFLASTHEPSLPQTTRRWIERRLLIPFA
jgi:hypothetical protein